MIGDNCLDAAKIAEEVLEEFASDFPRTRYVLIGEWALWVHASNDQRLRAIIDNQRNSNSLIGDIPDDLPYAMHLYIYDSVLIKVFQQSLEQGVIVIGSTCEEGSSDMRAYEILGKCCEKIGNWVFIAPLCRVCDTLEKGHWGHRVLRRYYSAGCVLL